MTEGLVFGIMKGINSILVSDNQPKIGLVLGGGGVRAFAHVGIYEVLEENQIPISYITGTSMGAIIGALIALGYKAKELRNFALEYKNWDLFSLTNFNYFNESLIKRVNVENALENICGKKTFKDCKIPFKCTSVDLESGKELVFEKGSLSKAVQASSSLPLIFPPLFYRDKYLVDGGIVGPVPALLARKMGAEKIVAVNIRNDILRQQIAGQVYSKHYKLDLKKSFGSEVFGFFKRKRSDLMLLVDIVMRSMDIAAETNMLNNFKKAKVDLLLDPVVNIGLLEFARLEEAIDLGRKIAEKRLPEIKKWLS